VTHAAAFLSSLEQFGIKFGLGNISALAESLGHPELSFPTIHIAGTNGKGSVTAMIDAALRAAGYHSARYTSPHLLDITERFVIDGQPVTAAAFTAAAEKIRAAAEHLVDAGVLPAPPTFFEATTAIAFELFRQAAVDVAVIEVGLGGRLDATNIVRPIATAITSIALDHEQYLGRTLEAIAREKAGIIKPAVPVVVGAMAPEARAVIDAVAAEQGAPIVRADDEAAMAAYRDVKLALPGRHQAANAAVAVRLLETLPARGFAVSREAIVAGLERVSWPGRLEARRWPDGRELLLDAAHNPDGAAALAAFLHEDGVRRPIVFAAMRDKDVHGMLRALAPVAESLVVTRASNPRAATPSELAAAARSVAPDLHVVVAPDVSAALAAAWSLGPRIVAAGSIFLLADVLNEIN
jgi:dihydrofolate synthase/folylpolyglutamate synthase